MKKAALQDVYVDQFMFYIPHRLVYADWESFIAEGPTETPTFTLPTFSVVGAAAGVPHLWYNSHATDTIVYSALRLYAYNLVWNEYFRDEEASVAAPTTALADGAAVNAKIDYWSNLQDEIGKDQADFTAPVVASAVSATEILTAIAKQKIAMKRATYGTRYVDILKGYGINVNYQMLQRPELVGIARGRINVTDVVDTSNAGLGELAGHGISGSRMRLRRKSFPEHGTLLGVMVLRQNYTDEKFHDWFDMPRAYDSFYDPGLVPLPAVEVGRDDIMPTLSTTKVGYQPWGQWYKRALSRVQTGMTDWSGQYVAAGLVDTFTNPQLKVVSAANFDTIFSDPSTDKHYQFSAVNDLRIARMIPRSNMALITGQGGH